MNKITVYTDGSALNNGSSDGGWACKLIYRGREKMKSGGDKIAQLVIMPCLYENIEVVESLEDTDRGNNDFGSTRR